MTAKQMREEVGPKWVFTMKLVGILLGAASPMVVALMAWLVTSSYAIQQKVGLIEYKVAQFAAAGPRYTSAMAESDFELARHETKRDIEAAVKPVVRAVDNLTGKMDMIEKTLKELHE